MLHKYTGTTGMFESPFPQPQWQHHHHGQPQILYCYEETRWWNMMNAHRVNRIERVISNLYISPAMTRNLSWHIEKERIVATFSMLYATIQSALFNVLATDLLKVLSDDSVKTRFYMPSFLPTVNFRTRAFFFPPMLVMQGSLWTDWYGCSQRGFLFRRRNGTYSQTSWWLCARNGMNYSKMVEAFRVRNPTKSENSIWMFDKQIWADSDIITIKWTESEDSKDLKTKVDGMICAACCADVTGKDSKGHPGGPWSGTGLAGLAAAGLDLGEDLVEIAEGGGRHVLL